VTGAIGDDPMARDAGEPCARLLDGRRQPVRLHELVQDVLQDVIGVVAIADAPADEAPESRSLARDGLGEVSVVVRHPAEPLAGSMNLMTSHDRESYGDTNDHARRDARAVGETAAIEVRWARFSGSIGSHERRRIPS
jgi:hypothetical protein